jgi:hypothetical protein
MRDALEEALELTRVEHRLRDRILGAGVDLPLEALDLVCGIDGGRVHSYADRERGRRADRVAPRIQPAIQVADEVR